MLYAVSVDMLVSSMAITKELKNGLIPIKPSVLHAAMEQFSEKSSGLVFPRIFRQVVVLFKSSHICLHLNTTQNTLSL